MLNENWIIFKWIELVPVQQQQQQQKYQMHGNVFFFLMHSRQHFSKWFHLIRSHLGELIHLKVALCTHALKRNLHNPSFYDAKTYASQEFKCIHLNWLKCGICIAVSWTLSMCKKEWQAPANTHITPLDTEKLQRSHDSDMPYLAGKMYTIYPEWNARKLCLFINKVVRLSFRQNAI